MEKEGDRLMTTFKREWLAGKPARRTHDRPSRLQQ